MPGGPEGRASFRNTPKVLAPGQPALDARRLRGRSDDVVNVLSPVTRRSAHMLTIERVIVSPSDSALVPTVRQQLLDDVRCVPARLVQVG